MRRPGGLIPAHAGKTLPRNMAGRAHGAHPRSRGENRKGSDCRPRRRGSSPLTRGKPRKARRQFRDPGLIPAHAGKTLGQDSTGRSGWAHPRSRGENCHAGGMQAARGGSSPLTRGKHRDRRADTRRQGLIPAHAGKTVIPVATQIGQAAHPRSRGENQQAAIEEQKGKGSSPLTRGKHPYKQEGKSPHGLIPAHAGKTRYWCR